MGMTASEKEIAKSIALRKIRNETGERLRGNHRLRRRGLAIAAAASFVLAFTAVAFAAGWINLGTIRSAHGDFEVAALADSPQLKAMQEYQDYVDEATAKGNGVGWSSRSYKAEDGVYVEEYAYQEKISELCEKYGLKKETVMYAPETFGETLTGAGIENFLGAFGGISTDTKNKYAGDWENSKSGYFAYWNLGSFEIGMPLDDGSTGSHHAHWYLKGEKTGVFTPALEGWSADYYGSESGATEWDYTTKDGYAVKCSLVEQMTGNSGRNEVYSFVLTVGDYMLNFRMRQPVPKGTPGTFTKAGLEKIIGEFDFGRLK
jgi:hypothetical protein